MKRLLVILLGLLWSVNAEASFTFSRSTTNSNGGSATTITAGATGITLGALVVVACGNDSGLTAVVDDGGLSAFTAATANISGSAALQFGWANSSAASGSVTYQCSFFSGATPTAAFSREIQVYIFTTSASANFDVADATGAGASGTATSSGNITTTGTDELVFGAAYGENATAYTAQAINGSAATGTLGAGVSTLYYLAFGSTFTGAATATANASGRWVSNAIAFKITGGGGAAPKRLLTLGVGEPR